MEMSKPKKSRPWVLPWAVANAVFVLFLPFLFTGNDPPLHAEIDAAFFLVMAVAWFLVSIATWFALKDMFSRRQNSGKSDR